jgi:hypothetical protein
MLIPHDPNHKVNGAETLYILSKIDRIDLRTQKHSHDMCEIKELLKRRSPIHLSDLSGWILGVVILVLAAAGKWAEVGALLGR